MQKVLIAEKSRVVTEALTENLRGDYEVHICFTGRDTIQALDELHPDALIINLSLPHIDGLTVLQNAIYTPPAIIALSNIVSDSIIQRVVGLGARCVFLMPCAAKTITARFKGILKAMSP